MPQASYLYTAIAHDATWPEVKKPRRASRPGRPATTPVLDTAPSQVKVQVQNGSGATGLAAQVSADLTRRGFGVVGAGDASTFGYTTSVIEYAAPADLAAVHTLQARLTNVKAIQDVSRTPGTITLIVGA